MHPTLVDTVTAWETSVLLATHSYGYCSGRKFCIRKSDGTPTNASYNDMVEQTRHLFCEALDQYSEKNKKIRKDQFYTICSTLTNTIATLKTKATASEADFPKLNCLLKLVVRIFRFFGNLFFDRNNVLASTELSIKIIEHRLKKIDDNAADSKQATALAKENRQTLQTIVDSHDRMISRYESNISDNRSELAKIQKELAEMDSHKKAYEKNTAEIRKSLSGLQKELDARRDS
jgi:chromosome segregation ATPase